jgi:hypothetical protein
MHTHTLCPQRAPSKSHQISRSMKSVNSLNIDGDRQLYPSMHTQSYVCTYTHTPYLFRQLKIMSVDFEIDEVNHRCLDVKAYHLLSTFTKEYNSRISRSQTVYTLTKIILKYTNTHETK